MDRAIIANVLFTAGCGSYFPEQHTPLINRTGDCGICFSGGGTRSMAAAMGKLRGLYNLGLIWHPLYLQWIWWQLGRCYLRLL
jgi:hypothetical protein